MMLKGLWIWNPHSIASTRPAIVETIVAQHVTDVFLKCADGNIVFKTPLWSAYRGKEAVTPDMVGMFKDRGVKVWGWGFDYGRDVRGEAQRAIDAIRKYGLDGWIADVEEEFCRRNTAVPDIRALLAPIQGELNGRPLAFCCFPCFYNPAAPSYQWWDRRIWVAASDYASWCMPMAYHKGNDIAVAEQRFRDAINQHREIGEWNIAPVGRAWSDLTTKIHPALIHRLPDVVAAEGAEGISWWSADSALKDPMTWCSIDRSFAEQKTVYLTK